MQAAGTTIQLTLMEAKLLRHLIASNGRTVSRKSILEDVWGLREDTDTRAIDNFIVRLRRYIEENPVAAGLVPSRELWRWSSAGWQAKTSAVQL